MYFLNVDRCAYGGRTDASKYFPEKTKAVRGPTFVASYKNDCSTIYSYDGRGKKWKLKKCNTTETSMACSCNAAGLFCCQSLGLLISFAAFCLLACEQSLNWKTRSILATPQPEGLFQFHKLFFRSFWAYHFFFQNAQVVDTLLFGWRNNLQACFF